MNDRHPSGPQFPTGTADDVGHPAYPAAYATHDALDGYQPAGHGNYSQGYGGYHATPYDHTPAVDSAGALDDPGTDPSINPGHSHAQDPYTQDPYTQDHYSQAPYQDHYSQHPYGQDPYGQPGAGQQDIWGSDGQSWGNGQPWEASAADSQLTEPYGGYAPDGTSYDPYETAPAPPAATDFPQSSATWGSTSWDTGQQPTTEWHHSEWGEGGDWHGGIAASADTDWGTPGDAGDITTTLAPPAPGDSGPDPLAAELAAQPTQTFQAFGVDDELAAGQAVRSAGSRGRTATVPAPRDSGPEENPGSYNPFDPYEPYQSYETGQDADEQLDTGSLPAVAGRPSRRRAKPKRSALLSVAAPSLCVLGVAGVAATVISEPGEAALAEEDIPLAAEPGEVEPLAINEEFDTQLRGLTEAADDYADRASRTQDRLDLEEWEAEEQRKAEEEAARKEAERPKFYLPVEQRGLSKGYNEAGMAWVGLHTGIDFPVQEGTPVRAATDGTIRTQYNYAYGNMVILTAPDGTETWYAHLSSTAYQSGYVQAGTVIAYSGNTGNSFGPHLHFEVRPGGGSHIDPSAWLRDKGLEPGY